MFRQSLLPDRQSVRLEAPHPAALRCGNGFPMEAVGAQEMLKKVGADPTGLPFNSVMALELHRGKPLSPLVNAGAMATVSLLPAANADEKWQKILDGYSQFAGHSLEVMDAVYTSEAATNSHNKGIAWLMKSSQGLPPILITTMVSKSKSIPNSLTEDRGWRGL